MTHRKVTKMTFFITSCYISELQYNVLMRFFELLEAHQMSAYKLAKMTGIPYTTIFDLVHYRTLPKNISLDHALKIADALDIDVKELVKIDGAPMTKFDFFRSQLIMNIKSYGPNKFVNRVVKNSFFMLVVFVLFDDDFLSVMDVDTLHFLWYGISNDPASQSGI